MWQDWVNGVLGLWIILMPFLGLGPDVTRMLLIVTGIVIAVLGFWSASMKRKAGSGGKSSTQPSM